MFLIKVDSCQKPIKNENSSSYVFTWVKDENDWNSDYVAVINSDPKDQGYGSLVSTLPVGFNDINAHHSEHRFHEIKELFVNGFSGGRSFIVDLNDPKHPKLKKTFTNVNQYLKMFTNVNQCFQMFTNVNQCLQMFTNVNQ